MKSDLRIDLKWVSLAVGVCVQCMMIGWFSANLSRGIEHNREDIRANQQELSIRRDKIYFIDRIADDITRMKTDLELIKKKLEK